MSTVDIEFKSVSKAFGAYRAVNDVSFSIPRKHFVSILGPSGCGKTTMLNMIAGFESPTSGQIQIRGLDQHGVPPESRQIGLVFQNYALFPHMTIAENVGFGLKMQKRPQQEIAAGIAGALRSVHLEGLEQRYPKEISGGQQQRTAVARAIAPSPSVLLLDEPLSNLDLKLREAMRIELKEIQQQLGMTFVYVTHDQEEAMAMSDFIIVMDKGQVAQQGIPADIYDRPQTSFVADFIGKSNIFPLANRPARDRECDSLSVRLADHALQLHVSAEQEINPEHARFCCIRPEAVRLSDAAGGLDEPANTFEGTVSKIVNLGAYLDVWVKLNDGPTLKSLVRSTRLRDLAPGRPVELAIAHRAIRLLAS